jgi:hypothetical protein
MLVKRQIHENFGILSLPMKSGNRLKDSAQNYLMSGSLYFGNIQGTYADKW